MAKPFLNPCGGVHFTESAIRFQVLLREILKPEFCSPSNQGLSIEKLRAPVLQRVIGIALIHPQILKIGAHTSAGDESAFSKDTSFRSLTQYFIKGI